MKRKLLLASCIFGTVMLVIQFGCNRKNEIDSFKIKAASILPNVKKGTLFWSASTKESDHNMYLLLYSIPEPLETSLAQLNTSVIPETFKAYDTGARMYEADNESSELQRLSLRSGEWYHRAEPIAPAVRKKDGSTAVMFSFRTNH